MSNAKTPEAMQQVMQNIDGDGALKTNNID